MEEGGPEFKVIPGNLEHVRAFLDYLCEILSGMAIPRDVGRIELSS